MLRGRCRFCKQRISVRYLLVECLTAVLTLLVWSQWQKENPATFELFVRLFLTYALIVVAMVDIEFFIIPNEITYTCFALSLVTVLAFPLQMGTLDRWEALSQSLFGALVGGGSLWLVGWVAKIFLKKEAMGLGDVKLMGMVGSLLGWKAALCSIMIASIIGSIVGFMLVIMRKVRLESRIAFGPFLAIGSFIFMMWGDEILGWYISFLRDFEV